MAQAVDCLEAPVYSQKQTRVTGEITAQATPGEIVKSERPVGALDPAPSLYDDMTAESSYQSSRPVATGAIADRPGRDENYPARAEGASSWVETSPSSAKAIHRVGNTAYASNRQVSSTYRQVGPAGQASFPAISRFTGSGVLPESHEQAMIILLDNKVKLEREIERLRIRVANGEADHYYNMWIKVKNPLYVVHDSKRIEMYQQELNEILDKIADIASYG